MRACEGSLTRRGWSSGRLAELARMEWQARLADGRAAELCRLAVHEDPGLHGLASRSLRQPTVA